ncbi:major facilitator superfamily domain-containing protein [Anaeramoeba flamelloides]|uniref:Major facilitator superfamily domain-containing protein n=1 Tax=Anaeramoeba flamelloides TaxID=1746091 RepID=A0ABQ8ZDJ9_9EUKA|nr:major facilitator superfamily domain-containing protein [Anaeramoeba flamelloides]
MSVLAEVARNYGANSSLIGLIVGSYSITELIGCFLLGWMSDRFGRYPILFVNNSLLATSILLTGLYPNKYFLLCLRFISGLPGGLLPVTQAAVGDHSHGLTQSNLLMARLVFSLGMGFLSGPLLVLVMSFFGLEFKEICLTLGVIMNILNLIWLFFVKDIRKLGKPKPIIWESDEGGKKHKEDILLSDQSNIDLQSESESESESENENENENENESQKETENENDNQTKKQKGCQQEEKEEENENKGEEKEENNEQKKSYKSLLNKNIFLLLILNFLFFSAYVIQLSAMPLLVKDKYKKYPNKYSSLAIIGQGISMLLSSGYYVPYISKKIGQKNSWNLSCLMMTICYILFIFLNNYWAFLILWFVYIFFFDLHVVLVSSMLVSISPLGLEGMLMGLGMVFQASSRATSPIFGLVVYNKSITFFYIMCAMITISMIPLLFMVKLKKNLKKK